PICTGNAAILDLSITEGDLQRHDLVQDERAAAYRVHGDNTLKHHAFRPAELAPHYREEFAHPSGVDLFLHFSRVRLSEKIRQGAREVINHLRLPAYIETVHDLCEGGVCGKRRIDLIRRSGEHAGSVAAHA